MATGLTSKQTKAERIARTIADEILGGTLRPGAALDETAIAARYGVSRTPIREAIRQLTASGVLETRAHRGAVVRRFSERQLDDMFSVMADLEALCARGAALAMPGAELRELDAIIARSADAAAAEDHAAYRALNDRFHEAIYAGAHNDYLSGITLETRGKVALFRQAQFETAGRLAMSLDEHRRVARAISSRDPMTAFDEMRAHIVAVRGAVDALIADV